MMEYLYQTVFAGELYHRSLIGFYESGALYRFDPGGMRYNLN